jgi:pimeloyl-ACP methyl ester carboxylesterase
MSFPRAVTFALLVCLLVGVGCQKPQPTALDKLHPCKFEEGPTDAYCGKIAVFENRDAGSGRKIDLKIVVAPALRRDPKPDPVFVLQGGPGAGAATLAEAEMPLFRRFQADRDIVLIDQRGTGGSNSLACSYQEDDAEPENYENVNIYPVDKVLRCMEKLKAKADLRLYTTTIAMDDVDEVRRALGYGEINVWGGSYGTRAALVYLKRHEASVRTVVLDSVAPPDMRLPLYMARDGQRALDHMFADCETNPACAKEFPKLREVTAQLFERLKATPRIKLVHPLTGKAIEMPLAQTTVAAIVESALYNPPTASLLPRLLWDAAQGNYQGLLSFAMGGPAARGAISEGMFLSVVCSEDMPRISQAEIDEASKGTFFGRTMFETRVKACDFWPRGEVAADYYEPVKSAKQVLILSGNDDPVTPPTWGDQVARALSNSKHLIAPGLGHGVSGHGCAPVLIAKLLDSGSVAGIDGACLKDQTRPPFFVSYTGQAAQAAEKRP